MAAATLLGEETAKKVIRQVEFYFSDSNLPRDAFLMKTIAESDDGMVSLALISSFSRMKGHLGLGDVKPENVSDDTVNAVAETLRVSSFLKVSEDGTKVGRVTELPKPEEIIKQSEDRTIAASPLEYDVKLEEIESFFQQYAKVNSVRLPRHVTDTKLFCGTALIEFAVDEDAANILKQTLCYSGAELELKTKKDFDVERAKQEENVVKARPKTGSNGKDKVATEPAHPIGLIVAFKLKNISTENSLELNGNIKSTSVSEDGSKRDGEEDIALSISEDTKNEILGGEKGNDAENAREEGEDKELVKTDADTEIQESEDAKKSSDAPNEKENQQSSEQKTTIEAYKDDQNVVLREDLKSVFEKFGTVKFIDFTFKSDSGYIRFEDSESAQKARTAAVLAEKGGLIVKNFIATLEPVTGDAEKEYWNQLRNNQGKHRDNYKNNNGRGGRHNKGGRHFGGKHSCSRDNDSKNYSNKVRKI